MIILDYTCRARWPEGQCVQRIKKCELATDDFAIVQSCNHAIMQSCNLEQDINICNHPTNLNNKVKKTHLQTG